MASPQVRSKPGKYVMVLFSRTPCRVLTALTCPLRRLRGSCAVAVTCLGVAAVSAPVQVSTRYFMHRTGGLNHSGVSMEFDVLGVRECRIVFGENSSRTPCTGVLREKSSKRRNRIGSDLQKARRFDRAARPRSAAFGGPESWPRLRATS